MTREWVWNWIHALTWHQHGGSGHNFSPRDVLAMTVEEWRWFVDKANQQRRAESRAIREAQKGR